MVAVQVFIDGDEEVGLWATDSLEADVTTIHAVGALSPLLADWPESPSFTVGMDEARAAEDCLASLG